MPVKTTKRGGKYRVVEAATGRIAKNKGGTAADGGGHSSPGKARAQVGAINTPKSRKRR